MTPEEFAERMKRIREDDDNIYLDWEGSHIAADNLICELLRELGYQKGVEIFEDMPKWYS